MLNQINALANSLILPAAVTQTEPTRNITKNIIKLNKTVEIKKDHTIADVEALYFNGNDSLCLEAK